MDDLWVKVIIFKLSWIPCQPLNYFTYMRILFIYLYLSLLTNASAQSLEGSLQELITTRLKDMPDGFAISIALVQNDEVEYIGLIKEKDTWIRKDLRDSLFEIGSLTKVFTSTLLADEAVQNRLKLNKPVNKVFPFKFNDKIKITYQSLANHTSGLYRLPSNMLTLLVKHPEDPYAQYSYEMFDTYLNDQLQLKPNEEQAYEYSNLGVGLLAYALSIRCDQPFERLLKDRIFQPYGMSNTAFDKKTSFTGISADGGEAKNWHFDALKGAGGLISSTADLSKFVRAQYDTLNTVTALTQKKTHTISENMSIGLGWHMIVKENSPLKYWHNGGTGGFTSSISFRPSSSTGVVILSNISAMHAKSAVIDPLCFELLDHISLTK
jgi:CubicO group peptidase (beta-lactamase class C family)